MWRSKLEKSCIFDYERNNVYLVGDTRYVVVVEDRPKRRSGRAAGAPRLKPKMVVGKFLRHASTSHHLPRGSESGRNLGGSRNMGKICIACARNHVNKLVGANLCFKNRIFLQQVQIRTRMLSPAFASNIARNDSAAVRVCSDCPGMALDGSYITFS